MFKISFSGSTISDSIAKNYINGLIHSGMRPVSNVSEIISGRFCVVENDVYFCI